MATPPDSRYDLNSETRPPGCWTCRDSGLVQDFETAFVDNVLALIPNGEPRPCQACRGRSIQTPKSRPYRQIVNPAPKSVGAGHSLPASSNSDVCPALASTEAA